MQGFDLLLACSGVWSGTSRVQVADREPAHESPSQLVVTPMLNNTFVRLDQTWSWDVAPQVGALLIGYDREAHQVSVHWVDTFHNGHKVMAFTGTFDTDRTLVAHGKYAAPRGFDWHWRIEIPTADPARLPINMFNLDPTGNPDGGAWADFRRV